MMSCDQILKPGESIRPKLTTDIAIELLRKLYGLSCVSIFELDGYDDRNFKVVAATGTGSEHQNGQKKNEEQQQYVFKILNSLDSRKPCVIEAQNELLLYLSDNNINCPTPIPTIYGSYYTMEKLQSGTHIVRLMRFLSGVVLNKVQEPPPSLFSDIGFFLAKLGTTMKKFHHPAYNHHKTVWMLESIPQVKSFLFAIHDEEKRVFLWKIMEEFEFEVLKRAEELESGMIHGDFNEQNILVSRRDDGEDWKMEGILDFGDSQYSCLLFELAIVVTYAIILTRNVDIGGHVLRGYLKVRTISKEEWDLLKISIEARICQSLVMGAYSSMQNPENNYILTTSKPGWEMLLKLRSMKNNDLLNNWKKTAME